MMSILPLAGVLAGLITLIAYVPYIRDIFKGKTKPVRATWFIWTVLSGIALTSQIASGGKWSVAMTIAQVFGVTTVFILSIKQGYGGLNRKEIISLIIAGLGLALWAATNKPLLALLCVVMVDAAGSWLTIFKSYKDPGSETLSTWVLDCVSSIFALIAIGSLNYTLILYPGYLFVANGAVVVVILLAKQKKGLRKA
jgi:hypothetical protein